MCGIVGFKTTSNFQTLIEQLPEAAENLSHRGPDDAGLFFEKASGVGIAHRRLSIIDLSAAGHQPMSTEDGKIYISYNGEIYNFKEIRCELKLLGHQFFSATDTEVVLKSYLQWGAGCLNKFIGMFAFAIWDGHRHTMFLARDRLGIKPLYYYLSPNHDILIFASELKALMQFAVAGKDIDPDAISLFLHYQYIPAPKTVFKNVHKLLPGHCLIANGKGISEQSYWTLPGYAKIPAESELSEQEAIEQLDGLLTSAVSDRLISDVPLGALLSGGIDSSVVVAIMQKVSSIPVKTFSIGFKEQGYDEAPWAEAIAAHLQTDHTELYVTAKDALGVVHRLPDYYSEPFADSSAIPTYLVSHLTRQQVTVALSGDGGDEQFAGYVRYWMTQSMVGTFNKWPPAAKRIISNLMDILPATWVENCYRPLLPFLPQRLKVANFQDKWRKLIKQMNQTQVSELYRMTICQWSIEQIESMLGRKVPASQYEVTFQETDGWPLLSQLMRVDQKTYLPDAMLTKVDRASMATGLEVRVPLLDHRVLEFTASLPESLKYRGGTGKYLLKKLLARYVPTDLFERPKMGFGVPIDCWLRFDLKDLLLDYLSTDRLKREGLFNTAMVEQVIAEHLSGRLNHQYRLWSLLMWEMWRERWLGD